VWAVTVSFGLVNVPVSVVAASRDLDLPFRQLHEQDGAPIDVQRWCSKENIQIPYEEITNGYELDDGDQVIVSDLELEAIEPRRTRTIDIEQFVDLADVDPMYFDHPYFLVPAGDDDGSIRAYRLLSEAMSRTDRAALGRLVMRAKGYLVGGAFISGRPDLNRGTHRPELWAKSDLHTEKPCKSFVVVPRHLLLLLGYCRGFPGFRQRN
jgi:DNA end-binding protein Ku